MYLGYKSDYKYGSIADTEHNSLTGNKRPKKKDLQAYMMMKYNTKILSILKLVNLTWQEKHYTEEF